MPETFESVLSVLRGLTRELEPGEYAGKDAAAMVKVLDEIERLAAASKVLMAKRVADTTAWVSGGNRSPAHWLARQTGTSVGESAAALTMADQLGELPDTRDALRSGRLSARQAREIADGAHVNPAAERDLLRTAERESFRRLRDEVRRAKVSGIDASDRYQAIKRSRYLRAGVQSDGAFELHLRDTADAGADVLAALKPFQNRIFAEARRQGRREAAEAYAADAIRALAREATRAAGDTGDTGGTGGTGDGKGTLAPRRNAKIIVRVDHAALTRGTTAPGEVCEITGIGPLPVATVKAMMNDAFLAAVLTDGDDVVSVAHLGRRVTAKQRTALEWRGLECTTIGCPNRHHLEIDHTVDWALTHHTKLDELELLCPHCHDLKTHHGYRLEPGNGRRRLLPPGHPDLLAISEGRAATTPRPKPPPIGGRSKEPPIRGRSKEPPSDRSTQLPLIA
jgi:hypothetical protein